MTVTSQIEIVTSVNIR